MNTFAALLVLLTGGLLAVTVSRRVSRPIEQIAADVDAIAAGDLDHEIRPVGGYELTKLAEKTGVMVDRLKDQIRQRKASEQRFSDLVRLLPLGVFETDLEGNVTFANPAALEVLGLGPDDLRRGLNIISVIAHEDRARAKGSFAAILGGGETVGFEYTGIRPDGSVLSMLVHTAARYENGAVAGVRGSIVDFTRLKQIEEEVRRMNAELEERVAQRTHELEAFTYSVSHDLRAPLRAIDGYSSILSETAAPRLKDREQHYLAEVRATVRQMNGLIDGLLALSRLDRQELTRKRISPAPLVMEVVAVVLEQDPERQVAITVGDLPPCCADPAMLRQVYANLIGNAVKFSRDAPNQGSRSVPSPEGRRRCITFGTMAWVSIWPGRRGSSSRSSACTGRTGMKGSGSASPRWPGSSSGTAAESGPNRLRAKARPSSSPCRPREPADRLGLHRPSFPRAPGTRMLMLYIARAPTISRMSHDITTPRRDRFLRR